MESIRSVSSTKVNPTMVIDMHERVQVKFNPKPCCDRILSSKALIRAHIVGTAPFPWPTPWKGLCLFPPYHLVEMPKAVQTLCLAFCKVSIISTMADFDIPFLLKARAAIHKTILS